MAAVDDCEHVAVGSYMTGLLIASCGIMQVDLCRSGSNPASASFNICSVAICEDVQNMNTDPFS